MSAYTPGPWIALPSEPDDAGFIVQPIQSSTTFGLIGEVYGGTMLRESAANGRLVAAAPELLDVLKAALQQVGCDGDLCLYQWHEDARAAIAKAEGRS